MFNYNTNNSIIFAIDSYEAARFAQLPNNVVSAAYYTEARKVNIDAPPFVISYGMDYFVKKYLNTPVTKQDVEYASTIFAEHGVPFNFDGWMYIVEERNGILPVQLWAVPDGTKIPVGVSMNLIQGTDVNVPWIAGWVQTALLRSTWYPSSVATLSFRIKQVLKAACEETGTVDGLDFKLHNFGARGSTCGEQAALGGLAHATCFLGTDNVEALSVGKQLYGADAQIGYSIFATEHSIQTMFGKEQQDKYVEMVLDYVEQDGVTIAAFVIDGYNTFDLIHMCGTNPKLKRRFDALKDQGKTVVFRPDSGDPTTMPIQVIVALMEYFGFEVNDKGYHVLPSNIRVIQGDGINFDSICKIIENLKEHNLSIDNLAFGMGGALMQGHTRDDYSWATKACYAVLDTGDTINVCKDPVTDTNKRSKSGLPIAVIDADGNVVNGDLRYPELDVPLVALTFNGDNSTIRPESLDTVRQRINLKLTGEER